MHGYNNKSALVVSVLQAPKIMVTLKKKYFLILIFLWSGEKAT